MSYDPTERFVIAITGDEEEAVAVSDALASRLSATGLPVAVVDPSLTASADVVLDLSADEALPSPQQLVGALRAARGRGIAPELLVTEVRPFRGGEAPSAAEIRDAVDRALEHEAAPFDGDLEGTLDALVEALVRL